jgi:hypothetical protein
VLLGQAPDMRGDPTSSFWHLFASTMVLPSPHHPLASCPPRRGFRSPDRCRSP